MIKLEEFKDILGNAFNLANNLKYAVIIDNELKEMTYMELGLFITSNPNKIEKIEITLRD